ncbi:MAG: GNAT family N-acetyltransferase [Caldilineaceae bacterium]
MNIRPARPETDIPGIAAVVNAFESPPVTLEIVQEWFTQTAPGRITQRLVAVDTQYEVIGYSVVFHAPWSPDFHFYVWVGVDPAWRGQGIGTALYAEAQTFLRGERATQLTSEILDNDPVALAFAQRRGFTIDRHHFASVLDIGSFDETPYQSVIPTLEAAGIRFCSLADFQDTQEARQKLHAVNTITDQDIPGWEGPGLSFAEFEQWVCNSSWYRPDGQLIAIDGEEWVGMCTIQLRPETQGAYNVHTGVVRSHRGRKIALALKLVAIRYARTHGVQTLHTNNDSFNAPMLAINRKLGYRRQPGKYMLRDSNTHWHNLAKNAIL